MMILMIITMVMMINDVNDDLDNDHADGDDDPADGGHLHHGGEVVVPRLGREPLTLPAGGKQHLAMRILILLNTIAY